MKSDIHTRSIHTILDKNRVDSGYMPLEPIETENTPIFGKREKDTHTHEMRKKTSSLPNTFTYVEVNQCENPDQTDSRAQKRMNAHS